MIGSINKMLESIKKISKLTLKFFPLNGEIDYTDSIESIFRDLRKTAGSKNGSIILNSPTSKDGIIELVDATKGIADIKLNVIYSDGSTGRINNDSISEKRTITIDSGTDLDSEISQIADERANIDSLKFISNSNSKIYKDNMDKIMKYKEKE